MTIELKHAYAYICLRTKSDITLKNIVTYRRDLALLNKYAVVTIEYQKPKIFNIKAKAPFNK